MLKKGWSQARAETWLDREKTLRALEILFGCHHGVYSFPLTVKEKARRRGAALATGTYVVCLDCGREFPYDWNTMKRLKSATSRETKRSEPATLVSDPSVA